MQEKSYSCGIGHDLTKGRFNSWSFLQKLLLLFSPFQNTMKETFQF